MVGSGKENGRRIHRRSGKEVIFAVLATRILNFFETVTFVTKIDDIFRLRYIEIMNRHKRSTFDGVLFIFLRVTWNTD